MDRSHAADTRSEASDIDFLTVTTRELSDAELAILAQVHQELHMLDPLAWWMEGEYIPLRDFVWATDGRGACEHRFCAIRPE